MGASSSSIQKEESWLLFGLCH